MLERDTTDAAAVRPRPSTGAWRPYRAAVRALTPRDRRVLGLWAGAHLGLAVLAWMSSWVEGQRGLHRGLLGVYGQWDYVWYQNIAAHGYFSGGSWDSREWAFLPGNAVALAAAHLIVRDWVVAGLLVSFVAGGFAIVCVGRLGGERAALYLLTAPAAMYLMVGYSESRLHALALGAWMAVRRGNWPLAGILAGLAALVRINGLFLIAALLVAAATSARGGRWRAAAWASIATVAPASYEAYLWNGTGSWTAWLTANHAWQLRFVGPWQSLKNTWAMAFGRALPPDRAAMFQIEIACVALALALTLVLLWRRAWPEATYCGLAVAVLGTATFYQATPRALLVMWPLYVLTAKAAERRPWIGQLYLWASAPVAMLVAVYFFLGQWGA